MQLFKKKISHKLLSLQFPLRQTQWLHSFHLKQEKSYRVMYIKQTVLLRFIFSVFFYYSRRWNERYVDSSGTPVYFWYPTYSPLTGMKLTSTSTNLSIKHIYYLFMCCDPSWWGNHGSLQLPSYPSNNVYFTQYSSPCSAVLLHKAVRLLTFSFYFSICFPGVKFSQLSFLHMS